MKREEAIQLLKEIVTACETVDYRRISLKSPGEKTNPDSEGFELNLKNHFSEAEWKRLKGIVQAHGLSLKENGDCVTIYTPRDSSKVRE